MATAAIDLAAGRARGAGQVLDQLGHVNLAAGDRRHVGDLVLHRCRIRLPCLLR